MNGGWSLGPGSIWILQHHRHQSSFRSLFQHIKSTQLLFFYSALPVILCTTEALLHKCNDST